MKKMLIAALAVILIFSATDTISKPRINKSAMEREGFGILNDYWDEMTLEQQEAVLKQAKELKKELKKMTKEERAQLLEEAKETVGEIEGNPKETTKIRKKMKAYREHKRKKREGQ